MPKNVITADQQMLANVTLPNHGGRYATVGHKFIIDEVLSQLQTNGFALNKERYRMNINGEVAQGIYYLQYGSDEDLGLMFAWANSYDKTMRFRCAIGAYVFVCDNGIIAGDMSNYGRKHVGDAKKEVEDHIKSQIASANSYYNALVQDKEAMKPVTLTDSQIAELMGILYFKEDIITSSQLISIKDQCKNPAHDYNAPANSLWTIYNHITFALKNAHPKTWMEQQKKLHSVIKSLYIPIVIPVDPNQTNLIDQIDEIESTTEPTAHDLDVQGREEAEAAAENIDSVSEPESTSEEVSEQEIGLEKLQFEDPVDHNEDDADDDAELDTPEVPVPLAGAVDFEAETEEVPEVLTDAEIEPATEDEVAEQLYGVNNNEEEITGTEEESPFITDEAEEIKEEIDSQELLESDSSDNVATDNPVFNLDEYEAVTEPVVTEEPFTEEKFAELNNEVDAGAVGPVIMETVEVVNENGDQVGTIQQEADPEIIAKVVQAESVEEVKEILAEEPAMGIMLLKADEEMQEIKTDQIIEEKEAEDADSTEEVEVTESDTKAVNTVADYQEESSTEGNTELPDFEF